MLTRTEQRRRKQLEIEREQHLEDEEALKMTEVRNLRRVPLHGCSPSRQQLQRLTLLRSFRSVKFEFQDLDGLSWTDSIKQKLLRKVSGGCIGTGKCINTPLTLQDARATMKMPTFVVLTKADLALFAPEETICPSAVKRARAAQQEGSSPQRNSGNLTPGSRYGKRDGSRTRSPVKGLFSVFDTSDAPSIRPASDDQATVRSDGDQISPGSHPSQRTGAGVITSIFCSSLFSPTHGRKRSQTCSVAATPKSPPFLTPVANFASP